MIEYVKTLELDADVENLINAVDDNRLADALRALSSASEQLGTEVTVVSDDEGPSIHISNGDFGFTLHSNNVLTHIGG